MKIDVRLERWATKRELEIIRAVNGLGTASKAAKELKTTNSNISNAIKRVKQRAEMQGYAPENDQTKPVPDSQYIKGVTTQYDSEGNITQQWVKSNAKHQRLLEAATAAAEAISSEIPKLPRVKSPNVALTDTLVVYPIGDPHIGLYAWKEDSGDDWDCDKAEVILCEGFKRLCDRTESTHSCVIVNLGDWFHSDNQNNTTARSGHSLDIDSRWHRVVRIGLRISVYMVHEALKKHQHVRVINEIGNHDDHMAYCLSIMMNERFQNNPRVEIDCSPKPYHKIKFGKNLIGVTHGDKMRGPRLYQVMAEDWSADWADSTYRTWLTGHVHHQSKTEVGSMTIESFRTIIPKDSWHSAMGYRAGRDMCSITYHKDFGECARATANIHLIERLL